MKSASTWIACLVVLSSAAFSQEEKRVTPETLPSLPTTPQQWINSTPLTTEALQDKAVVFWYFEETCPNCEKKWPDLLATAKKYEGKPVLFVGVNSGTARPTIEQYLRRNKVTWPVILDQDRAFEKESGLPQEISLQNIYQVRILSGDGKFQAAPDFDIDKAAEIGVATAKWHIDPQEIPTALQATWQQVEFGNYPAASQVIKKNLTSAKDDIKVAAEKLKGVVDAEIQETIDAASTAKSNGEGWKAYKELSEASTRFRGYTLPASVAADLKELKNDEGVKRELTAAKAFDTLKQKVSSGKFPPKSVKAQLEKFLEQYGDTDAADDVKAALARVDAAIGPGDAGAGAAAAPPAK